MKANQVKLLISLAREIKTEKKEKSRVVATLQSAKILTKNGNFTSKFSNLNRALVNTK